MPILSAKKLAPPVKFERWLRIECSDKECKAWTFIPAIKLPDFVGCVVCRKRIPTAQLEKKGQEVKRR